MRILLTNDDGIHAPGIEAMATPLRDMGDLTVVAPDVEQSAVSHSITLSVPLRVRKVERNGEFFGYGVSGAPADCVKIALAALCDERPDVLVSGINHGANVGIDVFYSGTVAAAIEAAFVGVPSIAASIEVGPDADLAYAAEVVCEQVENLQGLAGRATAANAPLLNINVPARPRDKIRGIRLTEQCMQGYVDRYVKRNDPRGRDYFWLDGEIPIHQTGGKSDVATLREGYISVTPLKHDLTDVPTLRSMAFQED